MSNKPYLISLNVENAPAIVVGAGTIATRKIAGLLASGAQVTVIAPEVSRAVQLWADNGRITLEHRRWDLSDLERPALLTFAATDDGTLNSFIVAELKRRGRLVNGADKQSGRNFSTPAVAHADQVSIAVSTASDAGRDPAKAAALRDRIESELPASREERESSPLRGTVTLVGAGPGDPDLLTVGARRALARADVVVYDHLANAALLDLAPADSVKIPVGKHPFGEQVPQNHINAILVREGSNNRHVVRLKGGDPFLFGRGTEEAEALLHAGIPFRVLPGVTSLTGVLGSAGFAVTRRGRNHGFSVFSAAGPTPDAEIQQWAKTPGPIVVFMGVTKASTISRELIAGGRSADEPVAVVARGGAADETIVETTLGELPNVLANPREWTPALIAIGLDREPSFKARALDGIVYGVASGSSFSAFADRLRAEGARVVPAVIEQTTNAPAPVAKVDASGKDRG